MSEISGLDRKKKDRAHPKKPKTFCTNERVDAESSQGEPDRVACVIERNYGWNIEREQSRVKRVTTFKLDFKTNSKDREVNTYRQNCVGMRLNTITGSYSTKASYASKM